jgi:putative endonuclease
MKATYYVYMMSNRSGTLYVGMTNDIERRVHEHKYERIDGFTKRYKTTRLVYYEDYPDAWSAIEREKQVKSWRRSKKVELIQEMNPTWKDLAEGWYEEGLGDVGRPSQGR